MVKAAPNTSDSRIGLFETFDLTMICVCGVI